MTPRYLHHLFSDQDETVARYILRRRLDACARALVSAPSAAARSLRSPSTTGSTVRPISGRVFRAKFDMTPLEFRREQIEDR